MRTTFTPGQLWHDTNGTPVNAHGGGILTHSGVHYWFGEHKIAGEQGNHAHVGVHAYSSRDLYNWRDEGIALTVSDDPASDIAKGCILERPKVIYNPRTRQFVMWFHLERLNHGYGDARAGVAVADQPAGPYRFLHSLRPNAGVWPRNAADRQPLTLSESDALARWLPDADRQRHLYPDTIYRRDFADGQMSRDMTLFVDDDGDAYHLHAAEENGTLHISRLTADWQRPSGDYVRVHPGRFHEAPAIFKTADGDYFLITSDCTGWTPNPARLSRARHIFGPWEELGNPCRGTPEQMATTFGAQSTFVLKHRAADGHERFIFLADQWRPQNAIDGRHVWLPVEFDQQGVPFLTWHDEWNLEFF